MATFQVGQANDLVLFSFPKPIDLTTWRPQEDLTVIWSGSIPPPQ
jgi:hypothetical protein